MLSHYLGGSVLVDHFIAADAASINTDDHNDIEYGSARNLGRTEWNCAVDLVSSIGGDRRPATAGQRRDGRLASRGA